MRDEGGPAGSRLRLQIPSNLLGKDMVEDRHGHFREQMVQSKSAPVSFQINFHIVDGPCRDLAAANYTQTCKIRYVCVRPNMSSSESALTNF